ncbi:MAG: nucleotide exchange factor GrpE [Gemmatimonadetes bacterium]|nr:nucleotide exchange factor GrpE [Gemmatimonadota bacterium]NNK47520.1 nucleotide exchange factor GrpE [Gemmatimonadota bacterium]
MLGRKGERIDETAADDAVPAEGEGEAAGPGTAEAEEAGMAVGEEPESAQDLETEEADDPAQRLVEELESANDRHLRLAAEFENFRKRTRREQAELSVVAQAELARRLLPTIDDLARVSSIPPETTTVEALDAGLDLILRNLRKELEDAGLIRIEALGERFDPELHQGLMTAETSERELDDIISRVFVDGYLFRDRLVRPAQVEVLTYSPEAPEES